MSNLRDRDFNLWIEKTIQQLEQGAYEFLDVKGLIEELQDLGKLEKRALESNLMILLAHLLKLTVQKDAPETMKRSWYSSVIEHRKRIEKPLKSTPSLKSYLNSVLESAYEDGREIAIQEGKLASFGVRIPPESDYPETCPFTAEEILNKIFFG